MQPVNVALVGIGGYGRSYLRQFHTQEIAEEEAVITCAVDPTAKQNPEEYEWFQSENIPVYDTLEEMYEKHDKKVELVIIASPTQFHKQQSTVALENGSHVLCEKPLVPIAQQASELLAVEENSGGFELGVGFQWSFSKTMNALKKDILDGKYGKPVMAKAFISWPRAHSYYDTSTWKGKILGDQGQPILDSILANATAHYAHNIFFILGETQETALMPEELDVELYRANDIESFDTCFMRGRFANDAEFYYVASHAVAENHSPTFYYEFEKGVVTFNHWDEDDIVRGTLHTGEEIEYGNPFVMEEVAQKTHTMIRRAREETPVVCTTKTVLPHLLVSNAVFDFVDIANFPADLVEEKEVVKGQLGNHMDSLYPAMRECFQEAKLPSELRMTWSVPMTTIPLKGYKGFDGRKVEGYKG